MPGVANARQRAAPVEAGPAQHIHLEDGALARPDADKVVGSPAFGEKDGRCAREVRVEDDPCFCARREREQADMLEAPRNRASDPARRRLVKRHEPLRDFLRLTDEDHSRLSRKNFSFESSMTPRLST